jgi:hypothetical protein
MTPTHRPSSGLFLTSVKVTAVHHFNNAVDDSGNVRYAGNGNRLLSRLKLKFGMAVANKGVE